jgi:hypothetical protein
MKTTYVNASKLALFLLFSTSMFGGKNLYAADMTPEERLEASRRQLKMHMDLNSRSGYADSNSSQAIDRAHRNSRQDVSRMERDLMSDWREGMPARNYETGFLGDMAALADIERAQNLEVNRQGNKAKHEFPGKKK